MKQLSDMGFGVEAPQMYWYVYVLECSDGSYYTGYTQNLEKRIALHQK